MRNCLSNTLSTTPDVFPPGSHLVAFVDYADHEAPRPVAYVRLEIVFQPRLPRNDEDPNKDVRVLAGCKRASPSGGQRHFYPLPMPVLSQWPA